MNCSNRFIIPHLLELPKFCDCLSNISLSIPLKLLGSHFFHAITLFYPEFFLMSPSCL